MEAFRLNVDDVLVNEKMELPTINYLITPSKSQCNDNNFNDFYGSTSSKVVSQQNGSYKDKIKS